MDSNPSIAVIGGGIGGTTAAFYLKKFFGTDTNICVFDSGDEIGGRLATVDIDGKKYESGGAIFHPKNKHLVDFLNILGLEKKKNDDGLLRIYDGTQFSFIGSRWGLINFLKLIWRYGKDVFKIFFDVWKLLNKFARIYEHQEKKLAFTSNLAILKSMSPDFLEMLDVSAFEYFSKKGYSNKFINELLLAALQANYCQNTSVQAFVANVSIAGVMPGLWSVKGGNKLIPQRLLQHSDIIHQRNLCRCIIWDNVDEKYSIVTENEKSNSKFDIIILAVPLESQSYQILFENFPHDFQPPSSQTYQRCIATFIKGPLNSEFFGLPDSEKITDVLSCNNDLFFKSIGLKDPSDADKSSPVYKVFSTKSLSEKNVDGLFKYYSHKEIVDWLAYPSYSVDDDIPDIKLHKNLYYINGIEMLASAAEMSAIGGCNAAILAYNEWYKFVDNIDPCLD